MSHEDTVGLIQLLSQESVVDDVVAALPTRSQVEEYLETEDALAIQILETQRLNPTSQGEHSWKKQVLTFWEAVLKKYTSRSINVILGDDGIERLVAYDDIQNEIREHIIKPHLAGTSTAPGFALFYGEPGGGKTHAAELIPAELGYAFISISLSDVNRSSHGGGGAAYYGEEGHNISSAIDEAIEKAPSVLFMDEFSSFGQERTGTSRTNSAAQTTDALLQKLNEVREHNNTPGNEHRRVLIIGAANHIEDVDNAIKSRAVKLEFPMPNHEQRIIIAEHLLDEKFGQFETLILLGDTSMLAQLIADKTTSSRDIVSTIEKISQHAETRNKIIDLETAKAIVSGQPLPFVAPDSLSKRAARKLYAQQLKGREVAAGLNMHETNQMDEILPAQDLDNQAELRSPGFASSAISFARQNKLQTTALVLKFLGYAASLVVGGLAVAGAISVGVVPICASIVGICGVLLETVGKLSPGATQFSQEMDELGTTIKKQMGIKTDEKADSTGSKGPLRFSGSSRASGQSGKQISGILSTGQVTRALNEIASSLSSLTGQVENPSVVYKVANRVLTSLEALASNDPAKQKQVAETRDWLSLYQDYSQSLPDSAASFGDVSEDTKLKFRTLLFKALTSGAPWLVDWGKEEALRVGYSQEQVQHAIALNKKEAR